ALSAKRPLPGTIELHTGVKVTVSGPVNTATNAKRRGGPLRQQGAAHNARSPVQEARAMSVTTSRRGTGRRPPQADDDLERRTGPAAHVGPAVGTPPATRDRVAWRPAIAGASSLGAPLGIGLLHPLFGEVIGGAEVAVALAVIAVALLGS